MRRRLRLSSSVDKRPISRSEILQTRRARASNVSNLDDAVDLSPHTPFLEWNG
jgi:hypothetical protein